MGITEKLYLFCNFGACCRITAPAVFNCVFKIVLPTFCSYSDFNIDMHLWFLNIELCDTPIVTFSYCWWTTHVLFNKSEWTISIKVVFLVFVPVVATNEFAKNMILKCVNRHNLHTKNVLTIHYFVWSLFNILLFY